jgi:hypothetical protein
MNESSKPNNMDELRERFGERIYDKGREAFGAYCFTVGGLTHDGKPIPEWEELTDKVRLAWVRAANTVLSE